MEQPGQQGVAGQQSGAAAGVATQATTGAATTNAYPPAQSQAPMPPATQPTSPSSTPAPTQQQQQARIEDDPRFKALQRSYNQQLDAQRKQMDAIQQRLMGQLDDAGKVDYERSMLQMQLEQFQQMEQERQRQTLTDQMRNELYSFVHPEIGLKPDEIPVNPEESRTPTLFVLEKYKAGYESLLNRVRQLESQLGANQVAATESGTIDLGGGAATGARQGLQERFNKAMKDLDSATAQTVLDEARAQRVQIDMKSWRN